MADTEECRILVVDDEPLMRTTVKQMLKITLRSSIVEVAEDGRSALERIEAFRPDVVLCDMKMSPMNGLAFVETLRHHSDARLRSTPVVMLTGHGDRDNVISAMQRGANSYLVKPISATQLGARVKDLLERQSRTKALAGASQNTMGGATPHAADHATDRPNGSAPQDKGDAPDAGEKQISPLLAETIHELRTPLNAVCGFADAMKQGVFGPIAPPKYAEYVASIHAAGLHMQRTVNGLLDLARAESGEENLEIQPVDIGVLVKETTQLLRFDAEAGGIELLVNIDPSLMVVRSDPTKLRQIILNLGSNAVKYTPRGGRVTIEAKPDEAGGALILVIRDTGVGIASEDLATAMRPFGRVKRNAATAGVQGTGLGLPLTQRYVDLIGGTLTIMSTPGHGTVVVVRLPMEPDPTPAQDGKPTPEPA